MTTKAATNVKAWHTSILVYFFIFGLTPAALMVRLPLVRHLVDVTTAELGIILFFGSIGAITSVTQAGRFIARFGTKTAIITGCPIVTDPAAAQFLWVAQGDEMPALNSLSLGSDAYPDQSATCVLEVPSLQADIAGWRLQGPGIASERHLRVKGLPKDFVAQWQANHAGFPRGVDVFLCTATQIAGLPRTTRILSAVES